MPTIFTNIQILKGEKMKELKPKLYPQVNCSIERIGGIGEFLEILISIQLTKVCF